MKTEIIDMTAIILTKNEADNLERCIKSVQPFVKRIVVVDSGSTDNTVELAKSLGTDIYFHKWKHYADQFNWAIDNTEIDTKWIFRIDADECVPSDLAEELILSCREHEDDDVNGMVMKYKVFFLGRFLKHGGCYPFKKLTVFKTGKGRFEDRAMGEHIVLDEGRAITLDTDCEHYDFKTLSFWIDKHNSYSTREVIDREFVRKNKENLAHLDGGLETNKKLRDGLYYKLPPFFRARLYYWYRFYIRMGFLDGRPGRIYAFLQAYWYRYLIDAKLYEKKIQCKL